jgi:hypothetical protein
MGDLSGRGRLLGGPVGVVHPIRTERCDAHRNAGSRRACLAERRSGGGAPRDVARERVEVLGRGVGVATSRFIARQETRSEPILIDVDRRGEDLHDRRGRDLILDDQDAHRSPMSRRDFRADEALQRGGSAVGVTSMS